MQFLNSRAIAAYALVLGLVVLMTGCGSKGQSSSQKKAAVTVTEVDISPFPSISLAPGQVAQMFAQALNANGGQVFTQTITFSSSNPAIQITSNGLICAGRWDSLTNPVVCSAPGSAGNPDPAVTAAGITSNITASAGGVTSPTTIASVHLTITSVTITPTAPACVAEAGTQIFNAHAFNGGTDITPSVGTFNWSSQNSSVATIPSSGDTGHTDQATATAVHPGQTNITASIGNITPVTSAPAVFTQCLVNSIVVSVGTPDTTKTPPEDATHFTVATAANRALTVVVKDTTGATLTTLPTLTWTSTQPSIAAVSSSGSVGGVAPGVVGVSASCLPNNCNIGTNVSVTSNAVSGTVTGTPPTTATAYVTCTDPVVLAGHTCTTQPSTTSTATQTQLFPINGATLGTAINLPHTPTSMMINPQNSRIYLGSTAGLMVVDAGANSFSSTIANAPGDVLAVAPNGNAVVISSGNDVFLYNGSTVTTLLNGVTHVVGATAAAFSPNSGKLLISTNAGALWFEIAGLTPNHAAVATATSIAWFPSGQFGAASRNGSTDYIDQNPSATNAPVVAGSQACGGLVTPLPTLDALGNDQILSADPAGTVCILTTAPGSTPFAVGAFTASQLLLSPDGSHAYLVGGAATIQDYTVGTTTKTPIALSSGTATTGGISANNTIYVGANDNTVHTFTFAGGVPTGAVTETSIPTTIPADLVVVKSK
jgi:hypothetical protein